LDAPLLTTTIVPEATDAVLLLLLRVADVD
jgi:hypothetical protein